MEQYGQAMQKTIDEVIYDQGKEFPVRKALPERIVTPHTKACYGNAYRLYRRRKHLTYCEGYVALESCPIPVMHGWCVNAEGEVLDPSVEQDRPAIYYGMAFKDEFVLASWAILNKRRYIGILGNLWLLDYDEKEVIAGMK
jgi:hypothetical protein